MNYHMVDGQPADCARVLATAARDEENCFNRPAVVRYSQKRFPSGARASQYWRVIMKTFMTAAAAAAIAVAAAAPAAAEDKAVQPDPFVSTQGSADVPVDVILGGIIGAIIIAAA